MRALAKKEGVDINAVPGTGKSGRVTKGDLLNFVQSGGQPAAATPAHAPTAGAPGMTVPKIKPLYGVTEEDQ